jgi:hypothetical protein
MMMDGSEPAFEVGLFQTKVTKRQKTTASIRRLCPSTLLMT